MADTTRHGRTGEGRRRQKRGERRNELGLGDVRRDSLVSARVGVVVGEGHPGIVPLERRTIPEYRIFHLISEQVCEYVNIVI